jgi:hypothetical protein
LKAATPKPILVSHPSRGVELRHHTTNYGDAAAACFNRATERSVRPQDRA